MSPFRNASSAALTCGLALVVGGCGLFTGPEDVAREYLTRGAAGDLERVATLVQEGCDVASIREVHAVRILGSVIDAKQIQVELDDRSGDRASVSYTIDGSVQEPAGETRYEGKLAISGSLSISQITKSGTLELIKQGMSWKIACLGR